jgi:hypothetical protein
MSPNAAVGLPLLALTLAVPNEPNPSPVAQTLSDERISAQFGAGEDAAKPLANSADAPPPTQRFPNDEGSEEIDGLPPPASIFRHESELIISPTSSSGGKFEGFRPKFDAEVSGSLFMVNSRGSVKGPISEAFPESLDASKWMNAASVSGYNGAHNLFSVPYAKGFCLVCKKILLRPSPSHPLDQQSFCMVANSCSCIVGVHAPQCYREWTETTKSRSDSENAPCPVCAVPLRLENVPYTFRMMNEDVFEQALLYHS